jgi:hypothetical protein
LSPLLSGAEDAPSEDPQTDRQVRASLAFCITLPAPSRATFLYQDNPMTKETIGPAAELADALIPADERQRAIDLIAALSPQGKSLSYMAEALRRARIPTSTGKSHWTNTGVRRLADKAGIKIAGYGKVG